ncbi:amidohydrolase family protein [Pleomorphomonas sp. T1.2MG-36]|uniref:amidohydrolase family protein n=1 Tax=Pleomorphomonas sp. T1.2MG-36 TaxID=3041167 RepID=UPI002541C8DD|nr:amidohydrolase family protein [Pleomorphomonas sp. T1.2MG-36]
MPSAMAATGDATTVTTGEALAMATRNGACALGASDRLGSIEVGKEADLILVDTGRLHAAPLFDPVTHLVYSAGRADVTDVFVGGRRIVEAGSLLTADVGALVAAAAALRPAIAGSVA